MNNTFDPRPSWRQHIIPLARVMARKMECELLELLFPFLSHVKKI